LTEAFVIAFRHETVTVQGIGDDTRGEDWQKLLRS